jgi:hypothetical protein
MKEERPKLALNKRTVARLNNLEMRHVRGGDGGDTVISNGFCDEKDKRDKTVEEPKPEVPTFVKTLTIIFQTRLAC